MFLLLVTELSVSGLDPVSNEELRLLSSIPHATDNRHVIQCLSHYHRV